MSPNVLPGLTFFIPLFKAFLVTLIILNASGETFPTDTSPTNDTYITPLIFWQNVGAAVHTISRTTTDIPTIAESGHKSHAALQVEVTTADTSIASSDYTGIVYFITGSDYIPLPEKEITYQIWMKGPAQTYSIGFQNEAGGRTYPIDFTLAGANTWTKFPVTLTADVIAAWSFADVDVGLAIFITLTAGTDFQSGPLFQWNDNDLVASENQGNFNAVVGNKFLITQMQLVEGARPGTFAADNRSLVKRQLNWYFREWNLNTAADESSGFQGRALSATQAEITLNFGIELRIAPPASRINFSGANTWEIQHGFSANESITGFGTPEVFIGKNSCAVVANVAANLTAGQSVSMNRNGTAVATLLVDARHYI